MDGTTLEAAINLAKQHFHVFPLPPNEKNPPIKQFFDKATTDISRIKRWWVDPVLDLVRPYNVGISTTSYNGGEKALLVVDVDNKNGKKGCETVLQLELDGYDLPVTYTQFTPTKGEHLVYWTKLAVKQGVNVLGPGLDIRSWHGYIVGQGSTINGVPYTANGFEITEAPKWLVDRCGEPKKKVTVQVSGLLDDERSEKRARHYLQNEAPLAVEGAGGDQVTFAVAAAVKDFGVDELLAYSLLLDWNERCSPPWEPDALAIKVSNAYAYGNEPVGVKAPETQFEPIVEEKKGHPFEEINMQWAFVLAGSSHHIIWETKDAKDRFRLRHISEDSFHALHASKTLMCGDKPKATSKLWMAHPSRRSYHGFCFMPEKPSPVDYYNLWQGFAVEALCKETTPSTEVKKAVQDYLDHVKENVCGGNEKLFKWLIGWFAHLVQKPWEKPLTAIVMRGGRGVGKNAVLKPLGQILGCHYFATAKLRYLTGDFNGHLENLLLFCLNEAFWSGNKSAEAVLKDIITEPEHNIEHKGQESFTVDNLTRIVIMGNDDWVVPAAHDERRYAIFDVGDGRKQDGEFFGHMVGGREAPSGATEYLLRYLRDFDLSEVNVNKAPATTGLLAQKHASLDPFHQWWLDTLEEGRIASSDTTEWPSEIEQVKFRESFYRYVKSHQISSRIPSDRIIGKHLKQCLPEVVSTKKRVDKYSTCHIYRFPSLEEARNSWNKFIGHPVDWEEGEGQ